MAKKQQAYNAPPKQFRTPADVLALGKHGTFIVNAIRSSIAARLRAARRKA